MGEGDSLLWLDRHRPASLDKLTVHKDLNSWLLSLAKASDLPHLLFVGPSGAGKRTRITCLLREIYGPSVERIKVENKTLKLTPLGGSTRSVDLTSVTSPHHLEFTPADAGIQDRLVIQEMLKEVASASVIPSSARPVNFKIVVLHEIDRLSRDAQHALRRTMEKYTATTRLILCATSATRIMEPLRSRTLLLRVPAPSRMQMEETLRTVLASELPDVKVEGEVAELLTRIAITSRGNMRRAVLMLEACRVRLGPTLQAKEAGKTSMAVQRPDWEIYIEQIAAEVLAKQSPQQLLMTRGRIYELLGHCIPGDVVLRNLAKALIGGLNQSEREMLAADIARAAADYDHRLKLGQKEIFHIEAFIAEFMMMYKRFLLSFG